MDRRNFLKVLGLTSSTALMTSCGVDKAHEKIIPYVIPPDEDVFPGKALYLNTTCTECPANCGLQVTLKEKVYHDVRGLFPTKLEGLETHPVNRGALCARGQAGLYRLYHPERIRRPMLRDEAGNLRVATWDEAYSRIREELSSGGGHALLSGRTSGSLSELIDRFSAELGVEHLPEYEPFSHAALRKANELAFGVADLPRYRLAETDFLLTIGADLFESFLSPVEFAADFARARKVNHLHWIHLEPHLSLTGVQANRRLPVAPEAESALLAWLIHEMHLRGAIRNRLGSDLLAAIPNLSVEEAVRNSGLSKKDMNEIASKLASSARPLLIAGGVSTSGANGLETALLAALLQYAMGMTAGRVDFSATAGYQNVGSRLDVDNLLKRLQAGKIGVFFVLQADPVGSLPPDLKFSEAFSRAGMRVGMADTMNATVRECDVILPLSHTLESWGDAEPRRGLRNLIQPALDPQYDTRSTGDILLQLLEGAAAPSYKSYLFRNWEKIYGAEGARQLVKTGFRDAPAPAVRIRLQRRGVQRFLASADWQFTSAGAKLAVVPSLRTFDGRSKDLPLLTEIPDPLSSISYGDWVAVAPETARKQNLQDRDEVEIELPGGSLKLPVRVQPLMPEDVYQVQRDQIPLPATAVDPRSGEASWFVAGVSLRKTGIRRTMPILSGSGHEEGRGLLPREEDHHHGESLYPDHEHENYRWGLAVDLESCIGCNACAAACYVENNVPLVGEEEHLKGREMSWIRLQPYFEEHQVEFVPMMCQQCDSAPCEPVCPVYASYHNQEGLNVQVYNRCVGTRYCSNNCPYKARRFNWFDHRLPEPLDKMYNPDLSVRGRGIMEKCTFCIQRIRYAKDAAKDEDRLVQDGEVVPACAQTCPTDAITFGNLMDEKSKVYQLATADTAYRALEELGTQPAVHYLKKQKKSHG